MKVTISVNYVHNSNDKTIPEGGDAKKVLEVMDTRERHQQVKVRTRREGTSMVLRRGAENGTTPNSVAGSLLGGIFCSQYLCAQKKLIPV